MGKLSDAKFLNSKEKTAADVELERVEKQAQRTKDINNLTGIQGTIDARYRQVMGQFPQANGQYEAVVFTHPESNRKIYGWLVAQGDEKGRVETGDGEYAIVPLDKLRRVGQKDDLTEMSKALKTAFQTTALAPIGIRADLEEREKPYHLEDRNYIATLNYNRNFGLPKAADLEHFVDRYYPQTVVTDVDTSIPGRLSLFLRLEADSKKDAEFDAAVGGEHIETLKPKSDKSDETHELEEDACIEPEADFDKTALNKQAYPQTMGDYTKGTTDALSGDPNKFFKTTNENLSKPPNVDPGDIADYLLEKKPDYAAKWIQTYVQKGGAAVLANHTGSFNSKGLLEAAVTVMKKVNPGEYNRVARAAEPYGVNAPTKPGAQQTTQQSNAVTQSNDAVTQSNDAVTQPNQTAVTPSTQVAQNSANTTVDQNGNAQPASTSQSVQPQLNQWHLDEFNQLQNENRTQGVPSGNGGTALNSNDFNHYPQTSTTQQPQVSYQDYLDKNKDKDLADYLESDESQSKAAMKVPKQQRIAMLMSSKGMKEAGIISALELEATMKMSKIARRGDYIVSKVTWDKDVTKGFSDSNLKLAVCSFVKGMLTTTMGQQFGPTGPIHILACENGSATVQFAALYAGAAPLETL